MDIVERLREYSSQRLSAHLSECDDPTWPTPNDVVLTKDALDLIESLRSRAEKAEAERYSLQQQIYGLMEKVEALSPHATCGCSWDTPNDLCMHHSPMLTRAEATCEKLAKALETYLFEYEGVYDSFSKTGLKYQSQEAKDAEETARTVIATYRKEASE
jgi:hypothetical protein